MTQQPSDPRLQALLPPVYEAVFHDTVDSVVAQSRRDIAAGMGEGRLIWAGEQQQGQGQNGTWQSPPGGLYCAIVLEPDFPRSQWPEVGLVALLALGTAVAELLPPLTGLDFGWPNDLLVNGHKVGGVGLHAGGEHALIVNVSLNVAPAMEGWEHASLIADGAAETTPGEALERYSRYFLDALQRWHDEGLIAICQSLRARGLKTIGDQGQIDTPTPQTLSDFFGEFTQ